MDKNFNIILGSGFSKSLANTITGQELSDDLFENFKGTTSDIEKLLINYKDELFVGTSSLEHQYLQIHEINEFYLKVKSMSYFDDAKQAIESNTDLSQGVKSVLLGLIERHYKQLWNYEDAAMYLNFLLRAGYAMKGIINLDEVKKVRNSIKKRVFDETAFPSDFNEEAINNFISLLIYLHRQGYKINIFNLNHDEVLENLVKRNSLLTNLYENFFDTSSFDALQQDKNTNVCKLVEKPKKSLLNHFQMHGSYKIIHDVLKYGTCLLEEIKPWEWHQKTEYISGSTLIDSDSKISNIFSSSYHSFCFDSFYRLIDANNPLLVVGYGGFDIHINSVLKSIYGLNIREFVERDKYKVMMFAPKNSERLLHELFILDKSQETNKYSFYGENITFEIFLEWFIKTILDSPKPIIQHNQ